MKRRFLVLAAAIFLASLLLGAAAAAQNSSGSVVPPEQPTTNAAPADKSSGNANAGIGEILARTTESAAHTAEKWGRPLGLSPSVSYAISIAVNFAGLALFFFLLGKSKLPQAFRERTAAIQKGIKEAQAASADASMRLSQIETRLSKLDVEVGEIKALAEREAAVEEERMVRAAEEDRQKVIEGAEAEISAIARNARRELKAYAAGLAVDMASRQLRVDESTDHTLVREFVEQMGKDGNT